LGRRALVGLIAAILGIGSGAAVGATAVARVGGKKHQAQCAKAPKSKAKHAKRRAECKKSRKAKNREKRSRRVVSPDAPVSAPRPDVPTPTKTTPRPVTGPTGPTGPTEPTGGIPAATRQVLLEQILSEAALGGDLHPYDVDAVLTTYGAMCPLCETSEVKGPEGKIYRTLYQMSTPVYFVAVRGEFRPLLTAPPVGAEQPLAAERTGPEPAYTVLTRFFLVTNPDSHGVGPGSGGFGNEYPDLAALGTPVELEP
jgi:hypothetical protein